ncbi:caspase family protein [Xanthocytophaga agilis]|uniref:Caspase family protein n=1 Tax=Xanthocytophaga agilis TaxID=3048010 RepID=A0AAE3UGP1_9BACT|nr:caspase family protein [Xanthocytophaga agilis]MDJ1505168.1 caspase family protein [Xanthocytophaga agilis]
MNAHALLIGIANYEFITELPQTVIDDVNDIFQVLITPQQSAYATDNVTLLLNENATKQGIEQALQTLVNKVGSEDTVLIYYSGHGGRLTGPVIQGEYLLSVDSNYDSDADLARTAISGADFSSYVHSLKARRIVIVFDCCHAAGITKSGVPAKKALSKTGLSESYLQQLQSGRGRVIIAASRDTEVSHIMPGARNSLFTQYLLEGLNGAVISADGWIRICDLFHYLQPKVTAAQADQHPVFKAEIEENFPIAIAVNGKTTSMTLTIAPSDGFEYDVFVSYDKSDKSWVKTVLIPALENQRLKICVDYKSFGLSKPIITEMERAVTQSRYTLAILTPSYLKNGFTEFEGLMATYLGLEERKRRFLAILKEDCKPGLNIRARMWLDMSDVSEFEDNITRLVYEIKQPTHL